MATTEQIAIELRVKNAQLAKDLKSSRAQVDRLANSMKELGNASVRVERQVKSVAKSTGLMATATKAFVGIAIVGFVAGAAKAFSQYASAVQGANNQLRAATNSNAEFQRLSAGTLQIANETGTSFESVANSAARFNRALSTFGGTVDQALIVTDSLSKSLLISGASTVEATAALQQFGQALESGILAGDEFRSLRENAPIAARAIASSLGISLGELRKLSEQGKLTTDIIAKALIDGNKKISEAAADIPLTLDRALVVAGNSFKDFLAESAGLNDLLGQVGKSFIELSGLLVTIFTDATSAGSGFEVLAASVRVVFDAIKITIAAFYTLAKAIKLGIDVSTNFAFTFVRIMGAAFTAASESVEDFAIAFTLVLASALKGDSGGVRAAVDGLVSGLRENLATGLATVGDAVVGVAADVERDTKEFLDGIGKAWDVVVNGVASTPIVFDPTGDLKKTAVDLEDLDKAAKKLLDTYAKLLKELQDYQTSQLSLPEQAQAQFDALIAKVDALRAAAKAANIAVDEAFLADVLASGAKELEKTLADQEQQWRDIVPPVNEAEAAARRYIDKMREIEEVGILLKKTTEEIEAQQAKFDAALDAEALRLWREEWVEAGKTIIDAFGGAFQSIIDGSVSAKDALRDLLAQLLILIAKAAILSSLGLGSFAGNIGFGGGNRRGADGGPDGFSGFSGRSTGSTVRIYNQSGGLVSTNKRSNGDVDVMIGNMATAISRGGNSFDQVMRRTYGLQRQGV